MNQTIEETNLDKRAEIKVAETANQFLFLPNLVLKTILEFTFNYKPLLFFEITE